MLEIWKGMTNLALPAYAFGYKKRMKRKEQYFCVLFERKTASHCRTPIKNNVVSIRCCFGLLPTRLPANRDCLLKP